MALKLLAGGPSAMKMPKPNIKPASSPSLPITEIGPMACYSERVKAWDRDTSREAVQKHYEETGEDENTQLITMLQHQTAEEYCIMMCADIRIKRDPLAMRMQEDQNKSE